ncbi:MAG TPA: hypothetical protein VGR37_22985 [Longimicrobiaceae bacterium]|nr:hypothetical protein [Longimicrobiaceae bacterium]
MHEKPIDLRPLHPARDPERWEAMIASVTARVLAEAAASRSPLAFLAGWARPTLAAAAAVAAVSVGVVATTGGEAAAAPLPSTVAEELRLPEPVTDWIVEERAPSAADLIRAVEGDLL